MAEVENTEVLFSEVKILDLPTFSVDRGKGYIKWGESDDYPTTLKYLADTHPLHGSILNLKARYLIGTKIKPSVETDSVNLFLKKANHSESWFELSKKIKKDKVHYGGYALLIKSNLLGVPVSFEHVDIGKIRVAENYTGYYIKERDGDSKFKFKETFYPKYKDGIVAPSIYLYKRHSISIDKISDSYPAPDYQGCLMDISTDVEISKFFNSLVLNGFSAGHIITFFTGELKPEAKETIKKKFGAEYQGSEGNKVALVFTSKDSKGVEIAKVDASNLHEQYKELNARNQQNIISGHNVPAILINIQTEGKLGQRNEIDLANEILTTSYVIYEQQDFNDLLKKFCKIKTGTDCDFEIEQFKPIGVELDLTNQTIINLLPKEVVLKYVAKKYGLEIPEAVMAPAAEQNVQQDANEHIKNLTGRQRQNLLSILNKYNKHLKGESGYTKEQALMLLKSGFNLNDEQANTWLGGTSVQMSAEDKQAIFLEYIHDKAIEINPEDELIGEQVVTAKDGVELLQFKKETKSFIQRLVDRFKSKITDDVLEDGTNVYTVYRYGLADGVSGSIVIPTTRDFCRAMVSLTSGNKRLNFETIDAFTNEFGESAWDFRGGFYNNGKETKPYCRHVWIAETRIRKK